MTRSRRRKLQRLQAAAQSKPASRPASTSAPLIRRRPAHIALAPLLLAVPTGYALAQQAGALDEIIVTAQKREESLQNVPASIQALSTTKLEQLNVASFEDYIKFLPSVSFVNVRPGFAQAYFRGVASAGDADANHSGSLPLVGTYLDEQPITTIQGALDVHLYDIARVEALAGPQGTLYGASSEAGTIRIITNKPDPSQFSAAYAVEGNTLTDGGDGFLAEGYVNLPLSDKAAIRLVGWDRHDAGFIDNVHGTRTFPSTLVAPRTPITTDNAASVKKDYNSADTYGARAALRIDLNDSWTITPGVMFQKQTTDGNFGFDRSLGKFKVAHGYPENSDDQWVQAALTVEGKIGNFDVVYAGSYLNRNVDSNSDYADYSYWYDVAYLANGAYFSDYFKDNAGNPIDFSQYIQATDEYRKQSHELRFSTPQDQRVRGIAGVFYQRQTHNIEQNYLINNLADATSVTGHPGTIWLTKQDRVDEDYALFGEVYIDITDTLTATVGGRWFKAENSLEGFFGFGAGFSSSTGEAKCPDPDGNGPLTGADGPDFEGAPCKNLDAKVSDKNFIPKLSLAWKLDASSLLYLTYSEGFRPGGINRRGTVPPYNPDFLKTYELGLKTSSADDRLRVNGAVFHQKWDNFQYSILGPNGLTEVTNAADAEIWGIETDVSWAVGGGLGISAGMALLDAQTTNPYCAHLGPDGSAVNADPCPFIDSAGNPATEAPAAPKGAKLPVSPDFKANLTARYQFRVGALDAHVQGAAVYVGERRSDLRTFQNDLVGNLPSYTLVDFTAGVGNDDWKLELIISNAFNEVAEYSRYAECPEAVCGQQTYSIAAPPRSIGVKFSQEF